MIYCLARLVAVVVAIAAYSLPICAQQREVDGANAVMPWAFVLNDPPQGNANVPGVKPIPSWNSPRLLMAYAAFFVDVVVSIFSSRFNASRSLGRCR